MKVMYFSDWLKDACGALLGRRALTRPTLQIAPGDLLGSGAWRRPKSLQAIL
jgi:hypothetical protein